MSSAALLSNVTTQCVAAKAPDQIESAAAFGQAIAAEFENDLDRVKGHHYAVPTHKLVDIAQSFGVFIDQRDVQLHRMRACACTDR